MTGLGVAVSVDVAAAVGVGVGLEVGEGDGVGVSDGSSDGTDVGVISGGGEGVALGSSAVSKRASSVAVPAYRLSFRVAGTGVGPVRAGPISMNPSISAATSPAKAPTSRPIRRRSPIQASQS